MYKEYKCKCGARLYENGSRIMVNFNVYDGVHFRCPNCGYYTGECIEKADLEETLIKDGGSIYTCGSVAVVHENETIVAKPMYPEYNWQQIGHMTLPEFAEFWNNCPPQKWNFCMGKLYVSEKDCYNCRLEWLKQLVKEK